MERFFRWLLGYVKICVWGGESDRFLNLCRGRGISMEGLERTENGGLEGCVSIADFFRLRPLRGKTGVHIHLKEKHGCPFFFYRNKKRKAFFVGMALAAGLTLFLSSRVWNIHIEGNQMNSTGEILEFLKEQGIVHGMAKSRVDASSLAALVREEYSEITWVSVKIQGTRLIFTIQEGVELTETAEEEEPCNLSADIAGTVVSIVTRTGVPKVMAGDSVQAGDLLVLGRLDLRNDDQEVYRSEYVHADADIYVRYSIPYYYEFSRTMEEEVGTGQIRRGIFLQAGPWRLELFGTRKGNQKRTVEVYPLRLTENFYLPVLLGVAATQSCETQSFTCTQEEARERAARHLMEFEENLMEKGVQISENNVTIKVGFTSCESRGTLTVIEKTGTETPVEYVEQEEDM
ncbi:MAG: sporulation protein YqfD [Clostridiales bacterium]|nr:sporulation protein YqfD [Clostridiales bacterium]